jgi:DNA-binding NtrC family response regulator
MAWESGTRGTILLLSSEPRARESLREVLQRAGYLVLPATNLGSAVDLLSMCPVDLLITHPHIESMPGHQAAKYLRQRNTKMGVLIVAGLLDNDRYTYRADLECFEIFPRPFSADQLVEEVDKVLKAASERHPGQ